jgi:hypothetical protein
MNTLLGFLTENCCRGVPAESRAVDMSSNQMRERVEPYVRQAQPEGLAPKKPNALLAYNVSTYSPSGNYERRAEEVLKYFSGPVIIAKDLMEF